MSQEKVNRYKEQKERTKSEPESNHEERKENENFQKHSDSSCCSSSFIMGWIFGIQFLCR